MPTSTQPQAANPATKRLILALGALVVLVLGYVILKPVVDPTAPHGEDPHTDNPALKAVKTFDYVGAQHTTDPVTYAQTPPAGGEHDPAWQDCGDYTRPLRNENAVHSLEHGTVWVTYRPGTSAADVAKLASALDAVKDDKTLLSPYPDLPAPVVITVWNAQLDLKSADDPRLATFISVYGDGHTAPEAAIASCAGGKVYYASPDNP